MKERLSGETYNKPYIAVPILDSPLFDWVQSINGHKNFYHITLLFVGTIQEEELPLIKDAISSVPESNCHVAIVPEKLEFIGENDDAFVLKIKNTDRLSEIRDTLVNKLPGNELNRRPFLPHITIQVGRKGNFSKFEREKLLDISDRSKSLGQYIADKIGLYYRTEEGATALLFSKKI